MNIGFIGAGKVGFSLGKYFQVKGLDVAGYYSQTEASAIEAAQFTNSKSYDTALELIEGCDIIFLTVPDGRISQVWSEFSREAMAQSADALKDKIICHCSGAMSSVDAFDGITDTGAIGYSFHPLFAVSDKYNTYKELEDVFFTIETETPAKAIEEIMQILGNPYKVIRPEDKTRYHMSAAIVCNLACSLIDMGVEQMTKCGFTENEAISAIAPMIVGNMQHIADVGPRDALTGPIERNDAKTVRSHLGVLAGDLPAGDSVSKEMLLYGLLSERLVNMASKRHPDRDYAEMSELLASVTDQK